ncbi:MULTISPECIES: thioredoxin family protein [Salinivibrio]|uniref:Co-chaperone YbbN n=1 Tax=Salinivibrio kushneri TaxID=1908198 RepID=A0AB36JZM6_9GAMM|nr:MULTISPECIES: co-chaperone YbbN [Salinivibrio]ODP99231.1 co-chaperone YbbN [Salinivibrio sp. BNH]OOE37116.1 co-chaperone YbbN [Salinivibrio kushneri]OOE41244.1 co-chaperone YbbN [Salinivibrio kushneri]OOE53670.1 co-chaperone YbbN [Salinivibrio kushneri]OOE54534.1 co-chaperone YbbN [Salinivibrio kushneri]
MNANYIVELTEHNFQQILESSSRTPVLVYFWANMMPESVELKPTVEQLAHDSHGTFTLATIDCEAQQMIAAQFGVRALPTLALFKDGQPVDGLAGPQNYDTVREMLDKHLPSQEDQAFEQARQLMAEGNYTDALVILKPLETSHGDKGEYKLAMAECLVETHQFDAAQALLDTVLMQDQDATYKSLVAKIELHNQAIDAPEIRRLQAQLEESPDDANVAYELAVQYNQINRSEEALELLMKILRRDMNHGEGEAKKTLMDILTALGQGNEVASRYRRQLYSLLY